MIPLFGSLVEGAGRCPVELTRVESSQEHMAVGVTHREPGILHAALSAAGGVCHGDQSPVPALTLHFGGDLGQVP